MPEHSPDRLPTVAPGHPKLDELIAVLARLRAPGGCAWDFEQTHDTLVKHLIEETHELVDAIEFGGRDELLEELGDVLYQVIFHADIAAHYERAPFDLEDVAAHMTAKMVGRHPHVFANAVAETADDVMAVWDDLKSAEKPHRTSVLDGIPQSMPSLLLADKLLGKAAKIGYRVPEFDEPDAAPRATAPPAATAPAMATAPRALVTIADEAELGTLLLSIVGAARVAGFDAERALRSTLRELQRGIRAAEDTYEGTGGGEPPAAAPANN